jgi:hypothetical protein
LLHEDTLKTQEWENTGNNGFHALQNSYDEDRGETKKFLTRDLFIGVFGSSIPPRAFNKLNRFKGA